MRGPIFPWPVYCQRVNDTTIYGINYLRIGLPVCRIEGSTGGYFQGGESPGENLTTEISPLAPMTFTARISASLLPTSVRAIR